MRKTRLREEEESGSYLSSWQAYFARPLEAHGTKAAKPTQAEEQAQPSVVCRRDSGASDDQFTDDELCDESGAPARWQSAHHSLTSQRGSANNFLATK